MTKESTKKEGAWSGGPLGPYHVTMRYRGIGGGLGRLYEARNNETGNAALLLMPGPGGDLRALGDWQVRATANVTPPYLALELERAPESGQAKELTWMFDRWAAALGHIDALPHAQAHLTGGMTEPRKHPRGHFRWRGGGLAAALLLALAVLLWPRPTVRNPPAEHALMEMETPSFADATSESGASIMGFPMPDKPLDGQKKAPCTERSQKELRGGCWLELAERPPCPRGTAEYEGKCYIAVKAAPPVPTSISP